MNSAVIRYLQRRMHDHRDAEDGMYYSKRHEGDYEDGRRGVKGTGRRNRDMNDYEYEADHRDYADHADHRDYKYREDFSDRRNPELRLTKSEMMEWRHHMENSDGTQGPHYDMQQVMHAAEKMEIKFNAFDEKEFCTAVNYIYSDYGKTIKKYLPPDKELMFCAEMAKDFLDDADGPEPSVKLALYYHCIANA